MDALDATSGVKTFDLNKVQNASTFKELSEKGED